MLALVQSVGVRKRSLRSGRCRKRIPRVDKTINEWQLIALLPMPSDLYRTSKTSLTDDELLILDVIFDGGAKPSMLRQRNFVEQWNSQSHSLTDDQLKSTIKQWLNDGVLEAHPNDRGRYVAMTPAGGELWASERRPIWERYCTERYPATIRGRVIMSVTAVASTVRDDFLQLWPQNRPRIRRANIRDPGLIDWHRFDEIHVGLASYDNQPDSMSLAKFNLWLVHHQEWIARVESERTWWRSVGELQKFADC